MRVKDFVRKYEGTPQYKIIMDAIERDHYSFFGDSIYDEAPFDEMINEIEDITLEDFINYECGCTKVVVIYNEIVFKKTFTGYMDENDGESGERYCLVDFDIGVEDSYNYCPDYCAIEALVFSEAKRIGLDDFFAETIQVTENVYAQFRADYFLCGYLPISDLGLTGEEIREIRRDYGFDERIPDYAIGWWFIHKTSAHLQAFSDFLYDHNINDLHSSNIGFFKGEVKLFDYSGYNSGTENTF